MLGLRLDLSHAEPMATDPQVSTATSTLAEDGDYIKTQYLRQLHGLSAARGS